MTNALTVNDNHNNNFYQNLIKWFPGDRERIDAIYKMGEVKPREAAIELKDHFLVEKIKLYSKKSSQKKYAMAAAKLQGIREQIIVPENPWIVCFKGLCETAENIIRFKLKKELIRITLIGVNTVLKFFGTDIPQPVIDAIATGIAIAGKHLIRPLKIVAQKTKDCIKDCIEDCIETIAIATAPVVQTVTSFAKKAATNCITGAKKVFNFISKYCIISEPPPKTTSTTKGSDVKH